MSVDKQTRLNLIISDGLHFYLQHHRLWPTPIVVASPSFVTEGCNDSIPFGLFLHPGVSSRVMGHRMPLKAHPDTPGSGRKRSKTSGLKSGLTLATSLRRKARTPKIISVSQFIVLQLGMIMWRILVCVIVGCQ